MAEKEKKRKETRSPDGSIRHYKEKRAIDGFGRTRTVDVWIVRKRYRCGVCDKCKANKRYQHERKRHVFSAAEAVTALHNIHNEIADELQQLKNKAVKAAPERERTFFELTAYFEKEYVKPAVFAGDRQISGYRSDLQPRRAHIQEYNEFFGDVPLSTLTYADLRRYAEHVAGLRWYGKLLSVSTQNKRLSFLRRILSVGVMLGWMPQVSPFKRGESLISQAAENRRDRKLQGDEEERLIAACTGKRAHLMAIIYATLDTTLRRKELLALRWTPDDKGRNWIDLKNRVIHAVNGKGKILRPKVVPITTRLYNALVEMKQTADSEHDFVFPARVTVKNAFRAACDAAGITNLLFMDLRKTGGNTMIQAGVSKAETMKTMGHTREQTFDDFYLTVDIEDAQRIGKQLDEFHEKRQNKQKKGTSQGTSQKEPQRLAS